MPGGEFSYYAISALLAFIPALIWMLLLFKRTKKKRLQIAIFMGGILSVALVFALQYFLNFFPQFDIVNFLQGQITNQNVNYIILFIAVGITEELVKQTFVRVADSKFLLIETINDSIQFSLVSALGFSFAENIFYIYSIWTNVGIQQLFVAYAFRSIFTTCAHLIFSGFFGYYYGIAKFSLNIREQSRWIGKKLIFTDILSKLTGMPRSQAYKEQMILKGLLIAMGLHAAFDFLLQFNQIIVVVPFVLIGYFILRHLLKRKAGHLIMVTDVDEQRASTMAKTDEEVVIELAGMWFKEKRYVDVLHICERLLQRDPDNKIVQLFKAQAIDKMDNKNVYSKILKNLFPNKEERESIEKMIKEKTKEAKKNPTLAELPKPTPAPVATPSIPKDTSKDTYKL